MLVTQKNLARAFFKASGCEIVKNTISSSPEEVLESDLPFITKSTTFETYFDEKVFNVPTKPRWTMYL